MKRTALAVAVLTLAQLTLVREGTAAVARPDLKPAVTPQALGRHGGLLMRYGRTACYGTCPVYFVEVYRDGFVRYVGEMFVLHKGLRTGKLSAARLDEIRSAFRVAKFRELPQHCCDCYEVTDNPGVDLALKDDGTYTALYHYYGCHSAPAVLRALEERLDDLLDVKRWIGTEEERRKCCSKMGE